MADGKAGLTLAAVFVGWLLAQLSGIVRERLNRRRVRRCLLEELAELRGELDRMLLKYARQLQIHALRGIDNNIALPLSNHIFKNFYKDAVLSLNQAQRISYQMIHSHLDQINAGISEQRDVTRRINEKVFAEGAESVKASDGEHWGQTVIAGFLNSATLRWHVDNHLRQPRLPDLSLNADTHKAYLQYLQNVDDNIKSIMEAGKTLKREDFERIYRPEIFMTKALNPPAPEK